MTDEQRIQKILETLKPSENDNQNCHQIIDLVRNVAQRIFPGAKVKPLGSFATGTGLRDSDLDLTIVLHSRSEDVITLLQRLKALFVSLPGYREVKLISLTRVPILCFCTRNVAVDISIDNTTAVLAVDWLNKELRGLTDLFILLKHWFKRMGLTNVYRGGLSSYAIALMLIGFAKSEITAGCKNTISLLTGFFTYWTNWNFADDVLDPRTRQTRIVLKESLYWKKEQQPFLLSIIDPVDPLNDVAVQAFAIHEIVTAMRMCAARNMADIFAPAVGITDELVDYESE